MKELFPLRGIITVLNTPFDEKDNLDVPALQKHVDIAMDAGVSGFLVPAMASEVYKLNFEERVLMVSTVLDRTNGSVPVFAGTGETDLVRSMELLQSYLDIGCKNVLFQIPFKNKNQFRRHFSEMASLNPETIMLQDWDSQGEGLPDELIVELFELIESFRCLKIETVMSGAKYSRMIELTNGRLHVSGGWAVTQMIEGLKRGVHAFMPTGMHYIYTKIYSDFILGNEINAQKLFERILPILSFSNQHLDVSILFFKKLLHKQNIYSNDFVRQPSFKFDKIHEEIASKLIQRIIDIEDEIKLPSSERR